MYERVLCNRAYNKKSALAAKKEAPAPADPELSLQQELHRQTKSEALKDKLRMAAAENLYSEKVKMYVLHSSPVLMLSMPNARIQIYLVFYQRKFLCALFSAETG